ncbi:MAG: hypothetical protein CVU16_04695 [Betaproteobacteria bacterium HGW-Betaproteobacteria-10]|nr:MAG: hypothetical protein CVU16_04695 [Betaproteobacteria bacterium HGW-Betaproteobacteria-10]
MPGESRLAVQQKPQQSRASPDVDSMTSRHPVIVTVLVIHCFDAVQIKEGHGQWLPASSCLYLRPTVIKALDAGDARFLPAIIGNQSTNGQRRRPLGLCIGQVIDPCAIDQCSIARIVVTRNRHAADAEVVIGAFGGVERASEK